MTWFEFITAWGVFFLTHSVPIRPPLRPHLEKLLGPRVFLVAYSVLSLGTLSWLIAAAGRAPFVALWHWAPWQNFVPLAAMLVVCIIVSLAIGRPNPFSFGGTRNESFDAEYAGIVRFSRHPLLTALAVWAAAHIVPNGDLAHVLLFGVFAVFATWGGRLIDRRKRLEMGADWEKLEDAVAARFSNAQPISWRKAALRVGFGVAVYLGLLGLHPWLFGVSPLGG